MFTRLFEPTLHYICALKVKYGIFIYPGGIVVIEKLKENWAFLVYRPDESQLFIIIGLFRCVLRIYGRVSMLLSQLNSKTFYGIQTFKYRFEIS